MNPKDGEDVINSFGKTPDLNKSGGMCVHSSTIFMKTIQPILDSPANEFLHNGV
jgi:hypothetical protein